MRSFMILAIAVSMAASSAIAGPCRDAHGRFHEMRSDGAAALPRRSRAFRKVRSALIIAQGKGDDAAALMERRPRSSLLNAERYWAAWSGLIIERWSSMVGTAAEAT